SMAAGEYVSVSSQADIEAADLATERTELAADPRAAHARDELGVTSAHRARPVQAALSSATSFGLGAALPMLALLVAPSAIRVVVLIAASLLALVALGVAAARAGGAPIGRAALRVGLGGSAAIAVTAGVGQLFGAVTG
ncbi:MAG: VIT1/CCC1 transporter family protein, partial [Ilumatobacteraceae bacterium]